jgi:hypothetical protein
MKELPSCAARLSSGAMSGRGVLYAVDDDELARLGEAASDGEVRAIIASLEEKWDEPWVCELDKAWDAIHRTLTDGRLAYDNGTPPLSLAILGGARLHDGDDLIVTVKAPDEVIRVAHALRGWDRARFRQAYYRIPRQDYGDLDEADLEYVWAYFEAMRPLWTSAARAERAMVFSVEP